MIVVSGASGGIGQAILASLLELDSVLALYNSTPPSASTDPRFAWAQVDITDAKAIESLVQQYRPVMSRLTVVHLAACKIDGLVATYSESDWDRTMDVTLKGNFLLTRALLPLMVAGEWGRIIHVSSIAGREGWPGTAAYAAAKTALLGFSRVLAHEYGRFKITSNVLSLGYLDAGLALKLPEPVKHKVLERIPTKKMGPATQVADAIEYLRKSDYVNGAVIDIDGGVW